MRLPALRSLFCLVVLLGCRDEEAEGPAPIVKPLRGPTLEIRNKTYRVIEWEFRGCPSIRDAMRETQERFGLPWRIEDPGLGVELVLIPLGKLRVGLRSGEVHWGSGPRWKEQEFIAARPLYCARREIDERQLASGVGGFVALSEADASTHRVSFDAAHSWAVENGYRLPTEGEWEYMCRLSCEPCDRLVATEELHPESGIPERSRSCLGLEGLIGGVGEWTSSVPSREDIVWRDFPWRPDECRVIRGFFADHGGRIIPAPCPSRFVWKASLGYDHVGWRIVCDA